MKAQIEKQAIMEMADEIRRIRESYFGQADYLFAQKLFEDGYRKQSENMIEFPCKVGDTVYFPMETDGECNPYVDVGTVFALGIDERHTIWISVRYESGMRYYHTSDDFGKTVFLAQEEAEAALAKMKGGAE